jgi:DNA-binding IclR family transcriptional regulator
MTTTEISVEPDEDHVLGRPVSAIDRVTRVLDAFTRAHQPQTLREVTAIAGLPRSTTFRILSQLVDLEWLDQDTDGYTVGPRARGISAHPHDYLRLREAAVPTMAELGGHTSSWIQIGVIESNWLRVLHEVGRPRDAGPGTTMQRVPPSRHAIGITLLAAMTPERVDRVLRLTDGPVPSSPEAWSLHQKLAAIRRRHGIGVLRARPDAAAPGAGGSVTAPVYGAEGAIAAICVRTPRSESLQGLVPIVAFAATTISERLLDDVKDVAFPSTSPASTGPAR